MCCRRRGNRSPVVVTLGRLAYDKYQEHQAEKSAIARSAPPDPNHSRVSQESLPDQANNEILEKAGVSPPTYHDLIVSRAIVPPELSAIPGTKQERVAVAGGSVRRHEELSDDESFYDVSDGVRVPSAQIEAGVSSFVEKWKARKAERQMRWEERKTDCQSKCEGKKAERAARRAEKKARCGGYC
ncbi:hypothetical protein LTR85_004611 [Meristemomyces frigidus]|nr:hypothetical protein LTR85_004611 [Meristemomyces frigidus]